MSNISTSSNSVVDQEQLFTDLTPEEGSVIEGGATLWLYSATAIQANADFGSRNGDDVYARINGYKTNKTNDVDAGEAVTFNIDRYFSGTASINFFDSDGGLFTGSDEYLGGFTVGSTPTNGTVTTRISGSGSIYDVVYAVYA
ncbi:hypothetical protein IQ229_01030 [Nostoc cf. edaphicum LEGE 07299]|uniref:Uncharacterized protein n=1 Tax=Nostoc cf. edaphicum LEGE 07299 TaxID=2777974 RepID=A0ABR9TT61_9NOSO|nr:hypothetical protein [Nostoc edaphicum]MBE9103578.1 hypothetical protein [Nostoc cf. edaphicum LEGE 07299]